MAMDQHYGDDNIIIPRCEKLRPIVCFIYDITIVNSPRVLSHNGLALRGRCSWETASSYPIGWSIYVLHFTARAAERSYLLIGRWSSPRPTCHALSFWAFLMILMYGERMRSHASTMYNSDTQFHEIKLIIASLMGRPVLGLAHTQVDGQHGWLKVNGIRYEHDIIIHSDGLVTGRNCGCSPVLRAQLSSVYKADYFHSPLTEFELDFLKEEQPEVVIIGIRLPVHDAHHTIGEGCTSRLRALCALYTNGH